MIRSGSWPDGPAVDWLKTLGDASGWPGASASVHKISRAALRRSRAPLDSNCSRRPRIDLPAGGSNASPLAALRNSLRSGSYSGLEKACDELGLSLRTFQRWVGDGDAVRADGRTTTERPPPGNQVSEAERQQILEVANSAEFASLPPSQIVPSLADRGVYVASESSFYRVLRSALQQHHRGRARKRSTRVVTSHCATAPNQVWSWDITWLPAAVKGQYYYWYMMLDVFSRKIVAHEVHKAESAELAALLMRRASLAEGLAGRPLVLHSDKRQPDEGCDDACHSGELGGCGLV